jgi:hypothetical protein
LDFLAGAFFAFLGLAAFFAFFFFFAAMSFTPWFCVRTEKLYASSRQCASRSGTNFFCAVLVRRSVYELTMASRSISQDAPGPGGVSLR